jgi:hypothetical protein
MTDRDPGVPAEEEGELAKNADKERSEHPWASWKTAADIARDHMKEATFMAPSPLLREFFQLDEIVVDPHKYYVLQAADQDPEGRVDVALVDVDPTAGSPKSATPTWKRFQSLESALDAMDFKSPDVRYVELYQMAQDYWRGVDHKAMAMVVDPTDKRDPINSTTRWDMKAQ